MSNQPISSASLDILFREARSFSYWLDQPVTAEQLQAIYDLLKMAPTAYNCQSARFVFLASTSAKQRLIPCLDPGNVKKVEAAPVVVIVAGDSHFYEQFPFLNPHAGEQLQVLMQTNQFLAESTEHRNTTLQGGYLMMAARAMGLDCGPMSGFDNQKVDQEFFAGSNWQSNFLCCLGYGDRSRLHPREPRFDFSQACEII